MTGHVVDQPNECQVELPGAIVYPMPDQGDGWVSGDVVQQFGGSQL